MGDKYQSLTELLSAWFGGAFTTLFGALMGRLMWHGNEARKGRRKFIGLELAWELPVAFGMAIVGEGISAYLTLAQPTSTGLVACLAYLGPRGTEVLFQRWFGKKIIGE